MNSEKIRFCYVGPQRTGSSWLHRILARHEEIALPASVKETFFFDREFERGIEYHLQHFDSSPNGKLRLLGEISPTYFHSKAVAERLFQHNPECKIIIVARHPVDKAESLFQHHSAKGRVGKHFVDAVEKFPEIIASGHYAEWVPLWQGLFGVDKVLLLPFDWIAADPQRVVDDICGFLECSTLRLNDNDQRKYGRATFPRYLGLARAFAQSAAWLRRHRLDKVAEAGKAIGLKRVYRGGEEQMPVLSPDDKAHLSRVFARDIRFLKDLSLL